MTTADAARTTWTWETALGGVVPPIITPSQSGGEIDVDALTRVVEHVLAGGCSGLFALGGTGEGAWLTTRQRGSVVRATVAASRGRVPVLAGLMLPATGPARDAAKQAEDEGANALVVGSPYYLPVGPDDQRRHVEAILAAVDLPIVLYNIPSCTHHVLLPETVAILAAEPRILGVKDSGGDTDAFQRLLPIKRQRPDFRVLMGDGNLMVAEPPPQADGLVPGPANIVPHLYVALHKARVAGDTMAWRCVATELRELYAFTRYGHPITVIKAACAALGLGDGHPAPPLAPVTPEQQEAIAAIVRRYQQ